jgi:hypothetical protein
MRRAIFIALGVGLLACAEPPRKQAGVGETLPTLPLPPNAELISREGGEDALKFRFRSDATPDALVAYYREVLGKPPWRLVGDTPSPDGSVTLYAEQDGPPIWVTVRKADGAPGSFVDIAGAKTKK